MSKLRLTAKFFEIALHVIKSSSSWGEPICTKMYFTTKTTFCKLCDQVIMWWNYWHCGSKHNLSIMQSKIGWVCPQFFWSGNCGDYRWVRGPRSCRFCANDQIIHNNTHYTIHNTHYIHTTQYTMYKTQRNQYTIHNV